MDTMPKYYIVEASALPEVFLKVAEAKRLLESGEATTVGEATKLTGISRSAFYKYRDVMTPFQNLMAGRIITFQLTLKDRTGVLSGILSIFAYNGANILTINQKVTFLYFLILAVIGAIHFSRRSYNDKIRIRMYFRIFILMDLLAATVIFLQPQYFNGMLLLIIINTAPLIAHFIALTNTKVTNITFIVLVILTFLLTVFNAWSTLSLS